MIKTEKGVDELTTITMTTDDANLYMGTKCKDPIFILIKTKILQTMKKWTLRMCVHFSNLKCFRNDNCRTLNNIHEKSFKLLHK